MILFYADLSPEKIHFAIITNDNLCALNHNRFHNRRALKLKVYNSKTLTKHKERISMMVNLFYQM